MRKKYYLSTIVEKTEGSENISYITRESTDPDKTLNEIITELKIGTFIRYFSTFIKKYERLTKREYDILQKFKIGFQ